MYRRDSLDEKQGRVDAGLLILRLGLGLMLLFRGAPHLFGGPSNWQAQGSALAAVGIAFWPAFWGFALAFAEFFGALFLMVGFLFRTFCALILLTLLAAAATPVMLGLGWAPAAPPLEMAIVFFSLLFIGPGQFSLQALIWKSSE